MCVLTCLLERQICCYSVRADLLSSAPDLFVLFVWRIRATTPIRFCFCFWRQRTASKKKQLVQLAFLLIFFFAFLLPLFAPDFLFSRCFLYGVLVQQHQHILFFVWCICDREGLGKVDQRLKRIHKERETEREREKEKEREELTGKAWARSMKGWSGFMKMTARIGTFWNRNLPVHALVA